MTSDGRRPVAVFISNLRTLDDMTGLYPPDWHERVLAARQSPGYISSPPFDIAGVATGYLVLMLRSGEEVMRDMAGAAALVMEMTRYAVETLDGDVIGLGSLTTSITHGGQDVADLIDRQGWKIRATHGDSGSVAAIIECLDNAGVRPEAKIGLVGAYGVIGTALSRHYAKTSSQLVCCGPRPEKLLELVRRLRQESGADALPAVDIRMMTLADAVITVTSHPSALLGPQHVRPGALVFDPAVPANTKDEPGWHDPERDNLVIANASQVRLPGVAVHSAMFGTFDEPDSCPTSYACLAETLANAVFGDREHHIGEIDLDFVARTARRFALLGFRHAVPRMSGMDISRALLRHALSR